VILALTINAILAIAVVAAVLTLLTWSIRSSVRRPQLAEVRLLPITPHAVSERRAA
jgi:hypothetical protein